MDIVTRRTFCTIAVAMGALVSSCQAQGLLDQANPTTAGQDGARLYDVSVFSGYSSSAYPLGSAQIPIGTAGALNADESYGAGATVGWQHHREKTNFSIRYSGTYSGMVHYSTADGYSQWLSLSADRKLSSKWSLSLSATGQDETLSEVVNQPSAVSVTSQVPADFNDFAASFGLGSYSTSQAASLILGAPVVEAPIRSLLLGNKILDYAGHVGLNYAASKHFGFHASGFASGGENRSGSVEGVPSTNYVLPRTIGATAGVSWTYSPSPRTDFGINVDGNRLQNYFQQVYTTTATASVGRKMGEHWFSKIYGGATLTDTTQQLVGAPETKQLVGGGSLGVKTYTDTFAVTYDRGASDVYGSAVGTFTNLSGTWNRHHPGSRLSTFISFGQQQLTNTGFESFSGWQGSGGFTERVSDTASLKVQYAYFKSEGTYLGASSDFSVQSVRLTLSWSPQGARR